MSNKRSICLSDSATSFQVLTAGSGNYNPPVSRSVMIFKVVVFYDSTGNEAKIDLFKVKV